MVMDQEKISRLKAAQNLSFEDALYLLRAGEKVMRTGWKNVRYIAVQRPDENSKMRRAYLYCVPLDNQACPWVISPMDLFAEDWQLFR